MAFLGVLGKTLAIKNIYDGREILETFRWLAENKTRFTGQILIEAITSNKKMASLLLVREGRLVAISSTHPISGLDEFIKEILDAREGYLEIQELDKAKFELALEYLPKNTTLLLNSGPELILLSREASKLLQEKAQSKSIEEKEAVKTDIGVKEEIKEEEKTQENFKWLKAHASPEIDKYSQNYSDNITYILVNILGDTRIPLDEIKGKKLRDVISLVTERNTSIYKVLSIPSECIGRRVELHFCGNKIAVAIAFNRYYEIESIGTEVLKELARNLDCIPKKPYRIYIIDHSFEAYREIQEKIGCKIEQRVVEERREKSTSFLLRLFRRTR